MQFIHADTADEPAKFVQQRLEQELASGKKVVWLVCGGSGVPAQAAILNALAQHPNKDNLSVLLMDERYGAVGHPDSNWQQLQDAGADFSQFHATPVLTPDQGSLDETAQAYGAKAQEILASGDVRIGWFGLGADAHTAGILPGTPAAAETGLLAIGYHTEEFDRITLSKKLLTTLDVAYLFAFGSSKYEALQRLQAHQESFPVLPSALLHAIPECYVYTDQLKSDAS